MTTEYRSSWWRGPGRGRWPPRGRRSGRRARSPRCSERSSGHRSWITTFFTSGPVQELGLVRRDDLVVLGGDDRVLDAGHGVAALVESVDEGRARLLLRSARGRVLDSVTGAGEVRSSSLVRPFRVVPWLLGGDADEGVHLVGSAEELEVVAGHHAALRVADDVGLRRRRSRRAPCRRRRPAARPTCRWGRGRGRRGRRVAGRSRGRRRSSRGSPGRARGRASCRRSSRTCRGRGRRGGGGRRRACRSSRSSRPRRPSASRPSRPCLVLGVWRRGSHAARCRGQRERHDDRHDGRGCRRPMGDFPGQFHCRLLVGVRRTLPVSSLGVRRATR